MRLAGEAGYRVLVAEEDEGSRRELERQLESWGYETILARDGVEAWDDLQRDGRIKLVLTAWTMPGLDGMELCRKLRREPGGYYRYVVMISGGQGNEAAQALDAGADDFLSRPVIWTELQARLAVGRRILRQQDKLIETCEELRIQATRDALTGLWNRGAFLELLEIELKRADRADGETGLLLMDVDGFKTINDTFGHLAGDRVLQQMADRLKRIVRSCDFVGRLGGDEFCIVLSQYRGGQLRERAERIRQAISGEPVRCGAVNIPITISVGAVVATGNQSSTQELIAAADIALYSAKGTGRNRTVCCARPRGLPNVSILPIVKSERIRILPGSGEKTRKPGLAGSGSWNQA